MTKSIITHCGGCHCGLIRFEFDAPTDLDVLSCNCSMCRRSRFEHVIVEHARFRLLEGQESLHTYHFNTGTAKHMFCQRCGVKSFYQPRSHPECYSVNLRCVDKSTVDKVTQTTFDGANWETAINELRGGRP